MLQYAERFWLRDFVGETASRRHDLRVDRRRARENWSTFPRGRALLALTSNMRVRRFSDGQ